MQTSPHPLFLTPSKYTYLYKTLDPANSLIPNHLAARFRPYRDNPSRTHHRRHSSSPAYLLWIRRLMQCAIRAAVTPRRDRFREKESRLQAYIAAPPRLLIGQLINLTRRLEDRRFAFSLGGTERGWLCMRVVNFEIRR